MRYAAAATMCVLSLLGSPPRAESQTLTPPTTPELVRCGADAELLCFRSTVTLSTEEARLVTHDTADGAGWSEQLGELMLAHVSARPLPDIAPPLHLLVLVDVSGSMKGDGLPMTRSALRSFLADLPEEGVRVAVAPFASRSVVERIQQAAFGSPRDALARLDSLPPPLGNTGLYSAVAAAVERVKQERQEGEADARGAVLVITDGRNDVGRAGDDRGLLAGTTGRGSVAETVAQSSVHTWLIGIGQAVDATELSALAATRGGHYIVALDPYRLARVLAQIRSSLHTRWELVSAVPSWARASLARGGATYTVSYRGAGPQTGPLTRSVVWRPPLLAVPAFRAVVDSAGTHAPAMASAAWAAAPVWRNLAIFGFFAALLLALWFGLPALLWPPAAVVASAPAATLATDRAAAEPAEMDGRPLRRTSEEAPPRRPQDITAAAARRVQRT